MADETAVLTDHNADLVTAVKEQTEQGKAALAALKTHSNAVHAGSTVHAAIESFGKVFEKLGHALDLHKEHAAAASAAPAEAQQPGELTDEGRQWEADQAAASIKANAETEAKQAAAAEEEPAETEAKE